MKNTIESFSNRLHQAKERLSEFEDRSFEIIQPEGGKKIRIKRMKQTHGTEELHLNIQIFT